MMEATIMQQLKELTYTVSEKKANAKVLYIMLTSKSLTPSIESMGSVAIPNLNQL